MNRRVGRVVKVGSSFGVVLPRDWIRGHDLRPGDQLEIEYDGIVRVRPLKGEAPAEEGSP